MARFHLIEKAKDGYRVKKEGPIHFVFRGSEHIGNILAPQLGGDKNNASKFTALAKHWGKKSTHPSKHSAMEWLKNSHGLTVRMEDVEQVMNVLNEDDAYKEKLAGMDNADFKNHFRTLYDQHVKNGMAPKYFKSPQHIAGMIEKQHKVPSGTYTGRVHEDDGSDIEGATPNSTMQRNVKKQMVQVVKKDPTKAIDNKVYQSRNVIEAFLRVYNEAKSKIDPDGDGDDDRTDDPTKNPDAAADKKKGIKMKHTDGASSVIQLPKTMTGQPGPEVEINPMMKKPYDSPDVGVNDQKKKPGTT